MITTKIKSPKSLSKKIVKSDTLNSTLSSIIKRNKKILKRTMNTDITTTVLNQDFEEDKTLILTTRERLKYFKPKSEPVRTPLSKQALSIWTRVRQILH